MNNISNTKIVKFATLNRITGEYKLNKKITNGKAWWFHVKHLIINHPGCKIEDSKEMLIYQYEGTK
jgi:hypothetical protein